MVSDTLHISPVLHASEPFHSTCVHLEWQFFEVNQWWYNPLVSKLGSALIFLHIPTDSEFNPDLRDTCDGLKFIDIWFTPMQPPMCEQSSCFSPFTRSFRMVLSCHPFHCHPLQVQRDHRHQHWTSHPPCHQRPAGKGCRTRVKIQYLL